MKKIFLTSGLAIMIASSAFASAHDIDTSNNLVGVTPTTAAACKEPTLGTYTEATTFHAKWNAKTYNVTYAPGNHGSGGQTITNAATYDSSYNIRGLGANTSTYSGVTANTGYHFDKWLGTSTNGADTTYDALPESQRKYSETGSINPYNIVSALTLTAQWLPNDSGAISLHADIYQDNNHSGTLLYNASNVAPKLDTLLGTSTVYSRYNVGLYTSSAFTTQVTPANLVPAKAGYDFNGFYTEDGSTQVIGSTGTVLPAALTQVSSIGGTADWYANWTPKKYTANYNPGTAKNGSTTHIPSGTTLGVANIPYDSTYTIRDNTNLFSQTGYNFTGWRADYNIGSGSASALNADYTANGTTYQPGDTPKWKVSAVNAVNLYAQWSPKKYDVRYVDNGTGTFTASANVHSINGDLAYYNQSNGITYDSVFTPSTPEQIGLNIRTGWSFDRWSAATNLNQNDNQTNVITSTYGANFTAGQPMSSAWTLDLDDDSVSTRHVLYLFAEIRANTYNVTYNPGTAKNGSTTHTPNGTAVTKTNAGVYDSAYAILDNTKVALGDGTSSGAYFTQSGYNFTGWMADYNINTATHTALNADYTANGTSYSAGQAPVWKLTNEVNLYAQWSPKKYPVRYAAFTQCGTFSTSANVHDTNITSGAYHLYYYEQPSNVTGSLTYDSIYTTLTPAQVGLTISDGYTFDGWSATGYASNAAITSVVGSNPLPAGQAMSSKWTIDLDDYLGYLGLQAACHPNQYHLIYDCGGYESTTSVPPVSHKDAKYKGALANASARDIVRTYDTTNTSAINSSDVCELPGYHITDNTNWTCIEVDDNGNPILNEAHRIEVPYASITGSNTTWSRLHNVKCTANWTPNTIQLNWRPGDNATANTQNAGGSSCTFDLGITVAGTPNKPGYTFLGWTTDPNNANVIDSGQ